MAKDVIEMMQKLERAKEIKDILEANKPLYEELDDITLELLEDGLELNQTVAVGGSFLTVVDNFADQNTIYRAMPSKRFDVKIETPEELQKRKAKLEKAAKKERS